MHQWYYPWSILVSITTPFISAYFMIQFVWQTEMCSYYTLTRMIESTQHWAMSGWQCSYRITSENIRHHVINKGGTMLRSVWSFHCQLSWPSDTCGQCWKIFKSHQCPVYFLWAAGGGGWMVLLLLVRLLYKCLVSGGLVSAAAAARARVCAANGRVPVPQSWSPQAPQCSQSAGICQDTHITSESINSKQKTATLLI